jgi:regulator of nucleoside diphosphate kinase
MQVLPAAVVRPPVTLSEAEADTLYALAWATRGTSQMSAALLLEELSRAEICDRAHLPGDVVTMLSEVVFCDEASGEEHRVQLVYPRDADIAQDRLSVLTPVGAALIGLRRGSAIDWPNRLGASRRLRIVDVVQPEPAG